LDHRVGQQLVRDLPGPVQIRVTGELELDASTDANGRNVRYAQFWQGVGDSLALRIENLRLQHHVDDDPRHWGTPDCFRTQVGADPHRGVSVGQPTWQCWHLTHRPPR